LGLESKHWNGKGELPLMLLQIYLIELYMQLVGRHQKSFLNLVV